MFDSSHFVVVFTQIMDYIELYIQWGYLTLFGAAFPVSSLLAATTNFIETRTDGRKLFLDFRRVLPNQVGFLSSFLFFFLLLSSFYFFNSHAF